MLGGGFKIIRGIIISLMLVTDNCCRNLLTFLSHDLVMVGKRSILKAIALRNVFEHCSILIATITNSICLLLLLLLGVCITTITTTNAMITSTLLTFVLFAFVHCFLRSQSSS